MNSKKEKRGFLKANSWLDSSGSQIPREDLMKAQEQAGEIEASAQERMKAVIRIARQEFEELANAEEEAGYQDDMITIDKTRAEGYAQGLQTAYQLFYKEEFNDEGQ